MIVQQNAYFFLLRMSVKLLDKLNKYMPLPLFRTFELAQARSGSPRIILHVDER